MHVKTDVICWAWQTKTRFRTVGILCVPAAKPIKDVSTPKAFVLQQPSLPSAKKTAFLNQQHSQIVCFAGCQIRRFCLFVCIHWVLNHMIPLFACKRRPPPVWNVFLTENSTQSCWVLCFPNFFRWSETDMDLSVLPASEARFNGICPHSLA